MVKNSELNGGKLFPNLINLILIHEEYNFSIPKNLNFDSF
jgi:hypothetical protein